MAEGIETHVRESDAFTLSLERDPLLRSTVVAIATFDRSPDWEALRDRVERATRLSPNFRAKLVPAPLGIAPPRWVVDPDFDLDFHLRRVEAPQPKTFDVVLRMACNAGMAAFDPARPLWEFTLVEGMAEGRAALIMKLHHALTDGLGGLEIAIHVVDFDPEPQDLGPMPPAPEPCSHGVFDELRDAVAFDARRAANAARDLATSLPRGVWDALRAPAATAKRAASTVAALARFVRPITETRSPVMTDRRLQWNYDVLDVSLISLKRAANAAGCTVNDAYVASLTGGLRRYHEKHGASVDTLRLTMPISMRREGDPAGSNRVTLVRFEVPVALEDPIARMREIDRITRAHRDDPALPYSNTVAGVLNLLPSAVTGSMLKHVDFLASNVPGFPDPVWVGGARLLSFHPFGPTLGSAANITLMSYEDRCHIGVNTDRGAVPDPGLFRACLEEGFDEVLAVATAVV